MVSANSFTQFVHEGGSTTTVERYIKAKRRCYFIAAPKCIFGKPHPLEVTQFLMKNDMEVRGKNCRILQKYDLLGASKQDSENLYLEFVMGITSNDFRHHSNAAKIAFSFKDKRAGKEETDFRKIPMANITTSSGYRGSAFKEGMNATTKVSELVKRDE